MRVLELFHRKLFFITEASDVVHTYTYDFTVQMTPGIFCRQFLTSNSPKNGYSCSNSYFASAVTTPIKVLVNFGSEYLNTAPGSAEHIGYC